MNGLLKKLKRLNAYLKDFHLEDRRDVTFNFVTGQEDAAPRLQTKTGIQVLIVRPEARISFRDPDSPQSTIMDVAFFVLEKDLGAGKTDQLEYEQYGRCLDVTDEILSQIREDSEDCDAFSGLSFTDAEVRPEVKVFGSWNGYSLSLSIE